MRKLFMFLGRACLALLACTSVSAQECPAKRLPIGSGWRLSDENGGTAAGGPFFATMEQAWQQTEMNLAPGYVALGLTLCSAERIRNSPLDYVQFHVTWSMLSDCSGYTNDSISHKYVPTPICPTGYQPLRGTYDGIPNTDHCVKKDAKLAVCPLEPNEDRNRGGCPGGAAAAMVGNPCNAGTGNKFELQSDYSSPTGLIFRRFYNSALSTPTTLLGKQWRSEFDAKLVFLDGTKTKYLLGPWRIQAFRPSGEILSFTHDGTTSTALYADISERLRRVDATTWELQRSDGTVEVYKIRQNAAANGSFGRLETIRLRSGGVLTLTYAAAERLATVTDGLGRTLTFGYASGKLSTVTDPAGKKFTYQYNAQGYLSAVLYPDATPSDLTDNPRRQYIYGDASNLGALTSIIDEAGQTYAQWSYDSSRRAVSSQHAGGADLVTLNYNSDGTTTVTDALSGVKDFDFSIAQSIPRVVSRTFGGVTESATYDANGFRTGYSDRNGISTTYDYDSDGLEISRTEAGGTLSARTITTDWDSTHQTPTQIDEPGRRTTYTYDANGNVLTKTMLDTSTSETRTWSYTYNSFGKVLTENGPRTD